jgi:ATP-dependent helicase/nuclease subunit B
LLTAVRDGAGLPAHGAAGVCGYCEMRGLCRRDYWERT